jgi:hypothetical protein
MQAWEKFWSFPGEQLFAEGGRRVFIKPLKTRDLHPVESLRLDPGRKRKDTTTSSADT